MLRLLKIFTLLLGVLTLLSMILVDRAEAASILNVSQITTTSSGLGSNSVSLSPGGVFISSSSGPPLSGSSASATLVFGVNAATDIAVSCVSTNNFVPSGAALADLTTSQTLLGCIAGEFKFGTVSLNPADTYSLSSFAFAAITNDTGSASTSFSGDFSITTPEPSTFFLLGIALISLALVRNRLEKGKERTSPLVDQPIRST